MTKRMIFAIAALLAAVVVGACAAPAASPAPAPAASGPAQVTLTTNPDPAASAGETELVFEVTDAGGQPLSGLKVAVSADMISHSMGVMQGEATDQGNGRYATKVPFGMAGDWKISAVASQGDQVVVAKDFVLPVK